MKKIRLLKLVLVGWGCAGVLQAAALTAPAPTLPAFGNLPLYFTAASPNPVNQPAQFVARGSDYQFLISPAEVQLSLRKAGVPTQKNSSQTVRMEFVGADAQAQIRGADELPGKINYLVGNNPAQWHTGVATFARLQVEQLYPGISLVYYGNQRQLEYDFTVVPGTNPDVIKIRFEGVDRISVGPQGELMLTVGKGEICQPPPVIYQTVHGARKAVSGSYCILDRQTVAFTVGKYDHRLPLVIDPVLSFSTYFGGNSSDTAWSVALDTNGFVYLAGQTLSKSFFYRPGSFQTNYAGGTITGDAFVAKLTTNGQRLVYFTYLGGNTDDQAFSVAADGAGDAYVTGFTDSTNFPVTNSIPGGVQGLTNSLHISGKVQPTGYYPGDAFVVELDPGGSNLVYSTYLGGSATDAGLGIATDSSGDAFVTGITYSTNFPITATAFQKHLGCTNSAYQIYYNANAFVAEISAGGSNLLYSSYFGGTNFDQGESIAVDNSNCVYITGFTASTNFPTTHAILQQLIQTNFSGTNQVIITNTINGSLLNGSPKATASSDAFVAKFAPSFTNLVYSTLLGGTNNDAANHIAFDSSGNAYVTGWTISTNFPNTARGVSGLHNGLTNNVSSSPFITNAFLTQVTYDGTNAAIGYSAVFGGTNRGIDIGYGVALDSSGDAFVVGASSTTNFPTFNTSGLFRATNSGHSDAFIIAFNTNCSAILYSGYLGGSGNDYGYGIAVDSLTNAYIVGQTASANFPTNNAPQPSLRGASDAFLAIIHWVDPPKITDQSSLTNQLAEEGQSVTFSITATGTPPLYYQWQLNGTNLTGTNIIGVTSNTLTINPVQTNDSGSYQVIVTNFVGKAISTNAVLTVAAAPLITQQPTNQTVAVGTTNVSFYVGGPAYAPPYYYQWLKDGMDLTDGTNVSGSVISGATNVPLTISNVQTNDAGNYWIVITNAGGAVTSSVATLTVMELPAITVQPTNQTVGMGSSAIFSVTATGGAPLSYQWRWNLTNLVDGGNISGSTSNVLTIYPAQTANNGNYQVVVTNLVGAAVSSNAVLTVLSLPPSFGSIIAAGGPNGGFILSGGGGTSNGTYYVLTSTNLVTPLAQWTPVATDQFGGQGQFVFTNIAPTNAPQLFYILQMQ